MTNPTDEFFEQLGHRGHEPLVSRVTGVMRFDVMHRGETDTRYLHIDHGHLSVSRDDGPADSVVRVDRRVMDTIVTGQANPLAALLRGALSVEGNPEMTVIFQRLLPPPANARRANAVETVAGW
jgi:putative sterol carrier protein